MVKERKSRAFLPVYESPGRLKLPGFEHPFERELNQENRWVVLSRLIPRDELCAVYRKHAGTGNTGRPGLNPRIVTGSLIIKYMYNLDDRETVEQISENIYMQYFPGYPSFSSEAPFDASLFVDLRKRMGMDAINALNERIVSLKVAFESKKKHTPPGQEKPDEREREGGDLGEPTNRGRIIFDATACPPRHSLPTDLDLLSEAREVSERLIDKLFVRELHACKPRTCRKIARKAYLSTAQKKNKSRKAIRKAIRKAADKQSGYLKRNLKSSTVYWMLIRYYL